LQQVVLNLVVNALDAMSQQEPSERQLQILSYRADPQTIRIVVRDSGPGIPEPQLSRIFEPFFTTKATGMGMGLVISRAITEAHDGRLWAINNHGRGATFYIALPTAPEENSP
jgi:C4-dicarboxylate-specific signal transduction histidine kinase